MLEEVNANYKFTAYYALFKLIQIQLHLGLELWLKELICSAWNRVYLINAASTRKVD